ncbi:MAG TPA: RodZ domain-containing protein [Stellaceae bacterium]|nr:RodZ domain-containing protein [Stellaceae bacterium]
MGMFKRQRHDPAEDEFVEVPDAVSEPSAPKGMGGLLRSTREGYGRAIADVAASLRIRPEYLEAIERNSVEGLPGPAYATGFVRAYAEYLGLDGVEAVRRFKQEKALLDTKQELSFPIPTPERGLPGSAMFLTALILAVLGYGTYYYVSSADRSQAPAVEAVPQRLLQTPPADTTAQAPAETPSTASNEPPAAATSSAPSPGVPVPGTPMSTNPVASNSAPPAPVATPVPPASPPGAAPTTQSAALPPSAATPGPTRPGAAARPGELPAVPPVAATDGVQQNADGTRVYGSAGESSRIVIRAVADSWVQVRDSDQSLLLTRVLKPGDTYVVPDKPGLSMRTGNAGALTVTVDGKTAPPLGALGVIKKNVSLDPTKLAGGTASAE